MYVCIETMKVQYFTTSSTMFESNVVFVSIYE